MVTISCFSYKGGAGRSTLAMNVVPYLVQELGATPKEPLIIIDMDVDSCGISYFLGIENFGNIRNYSVQALFGTKGTVPRDDGAESAEDHILFRQLKGVGKFFGCLEDRTVLCLPAEPGASLGFSNNYDGKTDKIEVFLKECEEYGIKGVLFDSAVGDQLTAKWSNRYSKKIICCMRPTEQFREGTRRFFDYFDSNIAQGKDIVVVPNVVPTDPLDINEGGTICSYPNYAKNKIIESFSDNIERNQNHYIMTMLEGDSFGVPKIDRFMWHESVLKVDTNLTPAEIKASYCYEKIAKILCEKK